MKKWEDLPIELQLDEVKPYYDSLKKKQFSLLIKGIFDRVFAFVLLLILLLGFLILAVAIKCDSKGPVFYRQVRITQYGKEFRIHKFRSMVMNADKGNQVTTNNDSRITKVGKFIRKFRLDEISQLIDILEGNMTFVGTRPEVPKYVNSYTNEMKATLLLKAGVTSIASIRYKDESDLLDNANNADKTYIEVILPKKMEYNFKSIKEFSLWSDIKTMFLTIKEVF